MIFMPLFCNISVFFRSTWVRRKGGDYMEDSKIIKLFYARSEKAIEELAVKYGTVCNKIANNILGNREDAEECVSDAYLAAWNTIPPEKPSPLISYICRLVRNISIKRYHANTAAKRNSFYDTSLDELEDCIPSPFSVESEMTSDELGTLLDHFLSGLDRQDRIMFVRRYWYSDSVSDIAENYGIGENNVSVRLYRIREKLKKYLQKEGYM